MPKQYVLGDRRGAKVALQMGSAARNSISGLMNYLGDLAKISLNHRKPWASP